MIIVFGAGYGCIQYLLDNFERKSSIAFIVDNNTDLHGTSLKDIKVFNPSILSELESSDFEVHITAVAGRNEIAGQLANMGIDRTKIKLIYKKPLATKLNLNLARKYLNKLGLILDGLNVNYLCAYGTLLGLIRDKDLLPHDDDLDFRIVEPDLSLLDDLDKPEIIADKSIFHVVKSKRFLPSNKFLDFKKPVTISYEIFFYNGSRLHIDFFLLCKKSDYYYLSHGGAMYRMPVELFKEARKIQSDKFSVRVPENSESVLKYIYGNWGIRILPKNGKYKSHLHKIEDK